MVRLLVAEDSRVTREYLAYLFDQDPDVEIVGHASDGAQAVQLTRQLRPDVILMDLHMPQMNGLEATEEIMRTTPTPIVLMSASAEGNEARMAFEAVQAGALTFTDKPTASPGGERRARTLVETVKTMAEAKVVRRWARRAEASPPTLASPPVDRPVRAVALGSSTGGPPALMEILKALPADFGAPIVLVQHIVPGFIAGLAEWLQSGTALAVRLAEDGERLEPGRVYVAPDGLNIRVARPDRVQLSPPGRPDGFCPSIDVLFESVAEVYGASALGVILTGMGRDGAAGLRHLRESGALTIAQDEATSAVFGMPREALRLNAAAHVLPLSAIAQMVCAIGSRR